MMRKTRIFEIDEVTYFEAKKALRDIFFMYYSMFNYNGFGCDLECGNFNPYWFLEVKIIQDGYISDDEVTILQQGAAVKLLSRVNDYLDTTLTADSRDPWWSLLEDGKFKHLPLAESTFYSAYKDYNEFQCNLDKVYKDYVLGLYQKLLRGS